ncbi:MAG TPA: trypsin-like peptidase domain-containing protein [Chloroflexota bacterium]|nr:trypsin-like peptidase domain-containing protein [Chloroflexota bacterium]
MQSLLRQKFFALPALGLLVSLVTVGALSGGHAAAPTASLNALDTVTTRAATAAAPSVVKIESSVGLGSGVIIDARGYIVTNYHVLFGSSGGTTAAPSYTVTLPAGTAHAATIAGTDAADDLAVLKIAGSGLKAMPLADSSAVRVGQFALAVGNPLGEAQSMTLGIVSTLGRNIVENGPAAVIFNMIQTSAPINPGNSGGALIDLQGRLVGIPTLAASDPRLGTAAQGIGFAIPSNRVKFIADQIIKSGKVLHSQLPYLGVSRLQVLTARLAAQQGLNVEGGVLVGEVIPNGPAAKAGLQAGEVLVRLGGTALVDADSFADALARLKSGQRVQATVASASGQRTVTITLGELSVMDLGAM